MEEMKTGTNCRLRFELNPLVRFCTLVGFCAGVGLIPIFLIGLFSLQIVDGSATSSRDLPILIVIILIGVPLMAAISFAIYALLAYPLYSRLKPRTYAGDFEIPHD